MFIKDNTFAGIYQQLLDKCLNDPHHQAAPRGMKIKELLHTQFELTDPLSCIYANDRRSTQMRYVMGETLWYFSGRNDVEFISNYSKFWEQIKNNDNTCNSAYGYMIFSTLNSKTLKTQWMWAIDSLLKDKDTRQAIIFFNQPIYQHSTKDFPCTVYGTFEIRDNKLNLSIKMRSNDLILGLQADIVFFVALLQHMHFHLKKTYLDLEIGSYYHYVDSLHIYERHFDLVGEMLNENFKPISLNVLSKSLINNDGLPSDYLKELMLPWTRDNFTPEYSIFDIIS